MNLSFRDRVLGTLLVVAGVSFQGLWLGRAAALLSVALVVAYIVWLEGAWSFRSPFLRITYGVGLVVFLIHVGEEFLHGFQRRLPGLVGGVWSDVQFLVFNAVWFATFLWAGWALRQRMPVAGLVVLFFAIGGGLGNGVGHLLLTLSQGAYFPGAWTAPLCLLVGGLLLWQLFQPRSVAA